MELFNKLKKILFDEVTTEIPVITKEPKKKTEEKEIKVSNEVEEPKKRVREEAKNEEVIIHKIETPKRERRVESPADEHFDMPKLKEEAKEEVKKSTFTFPVFDDDDDKELVATKRRERQDESSHEKDSMRERERTQRDTRRERDTKKPSKPRDSVGYTNAFDYSYGKYKGDYKMSREQSREVLTKTLEEKEEHKVFTPSPIISPVYGVLNENYKKEDIVSKEENSSKKSLEPLDLDSVRRKAYGTLEDEIEESLGKEITAVSESELEVPSYDDSDDEGISIDDLLVEVREDEVMEDNDADSSFVDLVDDDDDMELFKRLEEEEEKREEIEILPNEDDVLGDVEDLLDLKSSDELEPIKESTINYKEETKASSKESRGVEKLKTEKTKDKKEMVGEEDLFDLIESIYEGKGEE